MVNEGIAWTTVKVLGSYGEGDAGEVLIDVPLAARGVSLTDCLHLECIEAHSGLSIKDYRFGKGSGGALDHSGFNPNCSARSGRGQWRVAGGVAEDDASDEFHGVGVEGA